MIRVAALAVLTLSLSACASDHPPLAEASGPYRPLNVTHWTATADDLRGPRQPLTPAQSPALVPAIPASSPESGS